MAYNRVGREKEAGRTAVPLASVLLGVAVSVAVLPAVAFAQAPGNGPYVTLNQVGAKSHFDIFSGNGKPGPYTLTWNKLRVNFDLPVTVIMDGKTLSPNLYTVDAVKGTITFAQPVKPDSVVRVTYAYDPKVSRRNSGVASSPMTANLLNFGGASFQVTALPSTDAEKNGLTAPLAIGTGKKMNAFGGALTSKFNYGGADSLGMQMGYTAGNAKNGAEASFYRADKGLITRFGQTLGYADAGRHWNVGAHLTPSKGMAASFTKNDNFDGIKKTGKGQSVLAMRLGVGGATGTLLNFNRTEDTSTDPKHKETAVTTDKLDFAARLSKSSTMAATSVRTATDVPTANGDVTNIDRTLTFASVSKDQQSNATLTLNNGTKDTHGATEDRNNITVRLQAAPVFIVNAEKHATVVTPIAADGKEGKATSTITQCLSADIIPMPNAKVSGMVTETETNEVKISATIVQAQFGTGKAVEFNTGITNRSSEVPGPAPLDTTRAQICLRPSKAVTLTGGVTWNPETGGQVSKAQKQELGMTAKSGAWDLGGNVSLTTVNGLPNWDESDPQFGMVSLTCGLKVSKFSRLTGTYSDMLRYRSAASLPANIVPVYTRVLGFALAHDLGQAMTLSLGTTLSTNRANAKHPTDKKVDLKLSSRF